MLHFPGMAHRIDCWREYHMSVDDLSYTCSILASGATEEKEGLLFFDNVGSAIGCIDLAARTDLLVVL